MGNSGGQCHSGYKFSVGEFCLGHQLHLGYPIQVRVEVPTSGCLSGNNHPTLPGIPQQEGSAAFREVLRLQLLLRGIVCWRGRASRWRLTLDGLTIPKDIWYEDSLALWAATVPSHAAQQFTALASGPRHDLRLDPLQEHYTWSPPQRCYGKVSFLGGSWHD